MFGLSLKKLVIERCKELKGLNDALDSMIALHSLRLYDLSIYNTCLISLNTFALANEFFVHAGKIGCLRLSYLRETSMWLVNNILFYLAKLEWMVFLL